MITLLVLTFGGRTSAGQVLISEIFYHPASEDVREEFIEIQNTGTNTVNVGDWKFSRGIQFTFPPSLVLDPGAFLVIAADRQVFTNKYPSVTNVVGNWVGLLSNSGNDLDLDNAAGGREDSVQYADDGDWGIRQRGAIDFGHRGWVWSSPADGGGRSIELINPRISNNYGQNWSASVATNGTPGRSNSVAQADTAPVILDVIHAPLVPKSTDTVTVTARILDESTNGLVIRLHHRLDGVSGFTTVPMTDDGLGGDGLAGDGIFAALIPPQTNNAIIEFYLDATDATGHTRFWPALALETNGVPWPSANLLYQVDDIFPTAAQPLYKLILTAADAAELRQINANTPAAPYATTDQTRSHAQMNATFISFDGSGADVRYLTGVRNRGNGSKTKLPQSYNINFPNDNLWKSQTALNLNSQNTYSQLAGSALYQQAGLAMADSRAVQVRLNNANLTASGDPSWGFYVANEVENTEFADHHFPFDSSGNLYRGTRLDSQGGANLRYQGTNADFYRVNYSKQSNTSEDDWADLIHLTDVLTNSPDVTYVADVRSVVNVEQWMRYFAVNTLVDNNETCLANGDGDDFYLYRGVTDPRFVVISYDLDTVLGQAVIGDTPGNPTNGIFRMTAIPALNRFMKWPDFAPLYYRELKHQIDTAFAPGRLGPFIDLVIGGLVPASKIDSMKYFQVARNAYVLTQIPLVITISNSLSLSNGVYRTTNSTASLFGRANAIDTRSIRVNGAPASWSAWEARWTNSVVALQPGLNRILVQAFDEATNETDRATIDLWRDSTNGVAVGGTVAADTIWTAVGGPYRVTSSIAVPNGVTLTIEAGTTLFFSAGAGLTVSGTGRLLAEGTDSQHIRFTRAPGVPGLWGEIFFNNTTVESRVAFAEIEYAGSTGRAVHANGGVLLFDHVTFPNVTVQYMTLDNSAFIVRNSVFPTASGVELIHGIGIKAGGYAIVEGNLFGTTTGLNDIIDFTGGQRPGPIIQFLNNIFSGGSDDGLDLDGTDAHIEGNIFLNIHQSASLIDSSSAISGGGDGGNFSHLVIARNFFFDCDHLALAKETNYYVLANNTAVHLAKAGVIFDEPGRRAEGVTPGRGAALDGNIFWDTTNNFENAYVADPVFGTTDVAVQNSVLSGSDFTNGLGNLRLDPRLARTIGVLYQTITNDFRLRPGSPARGAGPNGLDMGALVPPGVSLSGEPPAFTAATSATLVVGGPGYVNSGIPRLTNYYRFRINSNAWSAPVRIDLPIQIAGLTNGNYRVEAIGQNSAGVWQSTNASTLSLTWTVNTNYAHLRLNEVLAKNVAALKNGTTFPDAVELYNDGGLAFPLAGLSLTDDTNSTRKFVFPANTPALAAGAYLILIADSASAQPGTHLGFSLKESGEGVYLYDTLTHGGGLIDGVTFGPQLPDLSIGRGPDGAWTLGPPTFGLPNKFQPTGDPTLLRLNEWLASARLVANNDFIELYNPDTLPVPLADLALTDNPVAEPRRSVIPPLSFIAAGGFAVFTADGDPTQGADHVNFKLSSDQGSLALTDAAGGIVDSIFYGPQRTDVAQGRTPSGADSIGDFLQPTPGAPNPGFAANVSVVTVPLVSLTNFWRYHSLGQDLGTAWRNPGFDDSAWTNSQALFYGTNATETLPAPTNTYVRFTNPKQTTFYFRTHFTVTNDPASVGLNLSTVIDDGAVIYLNGTEIYRLRMTAGPVGYATNANATVSTASLEGPFVVPTVTLVDGDNVLAVEVHQVNSTSTDMAMAVALSAAVPVTNSLAMPVVLNEVLAHNRSLTNTDGSITDWIELFNPGTNTINLSDFSLTDDLLQARRFIFPTGILIGSGGWLRIRCDGGQTASAANTGFALRANGGAVYFFDRPDHGGGLIDGVSYGPQAADFSIARVPDGFGAWTLALPSPGSANVPGGLGDSAGLRINEWMAGPSPGDDWFELYNPNPQPVDISGLFLTDQLNVPNKHPLPPLSFIGAGGDGYLRLAADGQPGQGPDHVNFSLDAAGEAIGLFRSNLSVIDAVIFGPQTTGISQGRLPDGATFVTNFPGTASPEEPNFLILTNLVINEVLAHTDPPFEDAIEFFNPTAASIDLAGWLLSNSARNLRKLRLPAGTVVPAGGFRVIYENAFNVPGAPGLAQPFTLNSAHGDRIILSSPDTFGEPNGHRAMVDFGATANGVSLGRFATSVGVDFVPLANRTFGADAVATVEVFRTGLGATNAQPLVGPVVINEIHFHPPPVDGTNDNRADEFIELRNLSSFAVPLFDPASPTNTWRLQGGVDFEFPTNSAVAGSGYLLIVSFDPAGNPVALADFRTRFNLDSSVQIFGPWSGALGNDGESVSLYRPDLLQVAPHPDAGFVPLVLVEKVRYTNSAPWPAGADGTSKSLQRILGPGYGNEPLNWLAAAPTPGKANTVGIVDADADGLADAWEILHFGSINDPRAQPGLDPDGDGMTNLHEFLAGTNPVDAQSVLRVGGFTAVGGVVQLQFNGVAGHSYSVLFRDEAGAGIWQILTNVVPILDGSINVTDPAVAGFPRRFYRLATPALPQP